MVQAPAFFTFAAQDVRRDWSRSVGVVVGRPAPSSSTEASKRKLERIGMVVLRSTTDCAAVSSRRSSARETVISRLPVGAATSGVMVTVDTVWSLPWGPSGGAAEGFPNAAVALILGCARGFVRVGEPVNFRGHHVRVLRG